MFHAGEFWKVGPSSSTRRHPTREIITGRRNSRAAAYSATGTSGPRLSSAFTVSAPFSASRDGHQVLPAASTTPPEATSACHCPAVIFAFFTGRQAWPEPSMIPSPVIAMSSAPFAQIGDRARTAGRPSYDTRASG